MELSKKIALSSIKGQIAYLLDIVTIEEVVEMIEENFDTKDRCDSCAHEYEYLQGA